ncbi:MAG: biotin-dependent carboxyltransferase family protein [Candidatus Nanopelagicales bacterium]
MIEVVAPGPRTLVQDLGRPGWAEYGVGPSGAFDRGALRLANRLVGNLEDAAALEALGGGLVLRALAPVVVAVAGAEGPVSISGRGADRRTPLHLAPGDELRLGHPTAGLRAYVAVRGGLAVPRVLGSACTDTLSGVGPAPVAAGDRVAPGSAYAGPPHVDHAPVRPADGPLRIVAGPRDDWFASGALDLLLATAWTVTPQSDRIGVRLDGPALERALGRGELPSEPVVTGALQVPPDGRPVLLGPDRPTTGGYPVIGVVIDDDLDRAAQLRPGDHVRFRLS